MILINYQKRKMLRSALTYGMSSVEVLNESIIIDGLINKLKRLDHQKDLFKIFVDPPRGYQHQYSKR